MMTRWGLEGMASFQQTSVSKKEEMRQAPSHAVVEAVNKKENIV